MEALMSMDDESLDYVLESCDAEELEIIDSAMEARYEDGPTTVTDKKQMKADYIKRKADSKKSSQPAEYDLDARLEKRAIGRQASQMIRYGNKLIDSYTGPGKSYTEQEAKDAKEKSKQEKVDRAKDMAAYMDRPKNTYITSNGSFVKGRFHPEGVSRPAINRLMAQRAYPNDKSKQADYVRALTKVGYTTGAKYLRNKDK